MQSADTGNLLAMFNSLLSESHSEDRHGEGHHSLHQGRTVVSVSFSSTETVSCRHESQLYSLVILLDLSPCR